MKRIAALTLLMALGLGASSAMAAEPKSKFYDFSDQLIDGEIKKPSTLYSNVRQEAKFSRMLDLRKELLPAIYQARKERVFK